MTSNWQNRRSLWYKIVNPLKTEEHTVKKLAIATLVLAALPATAGDKRVLIFNNVKLYYTPDI